jgi:hypothetical protein
VLWLWVIGGAEVLILGLIIQKLRENGRLVQELRRLHCDWALVMFFARQGRFDEASTAARRWRTRVEDLRADHVPARPEPYNAPSADLLPVTVLGVTYRNKRRVLRLTPWDQRVRLQ